MLQNYSWVSLGSYKSAKKRYITLTKVNQELKVLEKNQLISI